MTNIYTIGYAPWYDKWLIEQGKDFKKKGIDGDYNGGSAFLTIESAEKAIKGIDKPDYKVYKLLTDATNLHVVNGYYYIRSSCQIVNVNHAEDQSY